MPPPPGASGIGRSPTDAAGAPPDRDETLRCLEVAFEGDTKRFEWIAKHYYDMFAYHAAQRLTAFNFFVVSLSFLSNGYATLITKGNDARYAPVAAGLSLAAYLLVVAFGRLDKRNEQIIEINEQPLALIQAVFVRHFHSAAFATFRAADVGAKPLRTFGRLLPRIYALGATMTAAGLLAALHTDGLVSPGWAVGLWIAMSVAAGLAIDGLPRA